MALAFEQYGEQEGSVTTKKKKKASVDREAMAAGYVWMSEINLEESKAGEDTLTDGMDFYGGNW